MVGHGGYRTGAAVGEGAGHHRGGSRVLLGPTGVRVSKICLGTATFGVAPDAQDAGPGSVHNCGPRLAARRPNRWAPAPAAAAPPTVVHTPKGPINACNARASPASIDTTAIRMAMTCMVRD